MVTVLLVEDNPSDAQFAWDSLKEWGSEKFELVHVETLTEALLRLSRKRFDVVLLAFSLPDTKGLEAVAQVLRTSPGIPLVVLSDWDDDATGLQVVREGAQDFLVKGQVTGAVLTRAVRYAIERKRVEEWLAYLAQHDPVTGLANRILFRDRMFQALARSKRTGQRLGIMMLDLDRFKAVNDRLGHEAGDHLLRESALRFQGCVREMDTVSRIGGDEFMILLEWISTEGDLAAVARRILESIAVPFMLDGQQASVGVSIGITSFPLDPQSMDELLRHADAAMYRAKELGGHTYHFYVSREGYPALTTGLLAP